MCHKVKDNHPTIASEPISCVKVMLRVYDKGDDIHYSYRPVFCRNTGFEYKLGVLAVEPQSFKSNFANSIETGLHSFQPEVDGWKAVAKWVTIAEPDMFDDLIDAGIKYEPVAIMCVIPKNAKYVYGEANCINGGKDETGYVSNQLLPISEMHDEEWKDFDITSYMDR